MPVGYQERDEIHRHLGNVSSINMSKVVELTKDHSRDGEPVLRANNLGSCSTQLGIDLHANVGAVLRLSLLYVGNVDT
jgi:hypothetical protein